MRFRFPNPLDRLTGDFADLFRQLEQPSDPRTVIGGYATLMTRVASPEFRRRSGRPG